MQFSADLLLSRLLRRSRVEYAAAAGGLLLRRWGRRPGRSELLVGGRMPTTHLPTKPWPTSPPMADGSDDGVKNKIDSTASEPGQYPHSYPS